MSLETVGQLVAEHASIPLDQRKATKAELEQQIVRKLYTWMSWGLFMLGVGVLMAVTNKFFLLGSLFQFISIVLILMGVGVTTAGVFNAIKDRTYISDKKPKDQISTARDTKSLPTGEIPASLPSVTEHTTELLSIDDAPASERRTNKVIGSNGRE